MSGAVSTGTAQLLKFAIKMASLAVLARYLGPQEYGVVAFITAVTTVLGVFQDAGLSMATVQAPKISQLASSSMYWLNVALGLLVFIVIALVGPIAQRLHDYPGLIYLFPCFGFAAFLSSFRAQRVALLQREMQFELLAKADVMSCGLASAIAIAMAIMGFGIWSLVAMTVAQVLAYNIVLTLYHNWRPDLRYSHAAVKPLLRFGASILGSNVISRFSKGLDALVIGSFVGVSSLGIYNRAQNILKAPLQQLVNPLSTVARSAIFRTVHDQARFERGVLAVLSMVSIGSGLILLLSLSLADLIVLVLLGESWMGCVPVFMALLPFAFIEPCSVFLNSVLVSKGEASALLKWKIFNLGLVACSLFAGLPWGIIGVSLSYSLTGLLVRFPLLFLYVGKKVGLPVRRMFGSVLPILFGCVLGAPIAIYRNLTGKGLLLVEALVTLGLVLCVFTTVVMLFPSTQRSIMLHTASVYERLSLIASSRLVGTRGTRAD